MKLITIIAVTLFCASGGHAQQPVEFRYHNPNARTVFLAGDFNGWSTSTTPMSKDAAGAWTATVSLQPGRYQYKFVVDGLWTPDPSNPETGTPGPGGKNSVKVVSASVAQAPSAAKSTASIAAGDLQLGGKQVEPKRLIEFEAPISTVAWESASRLPKAGDGGLSHSPTVKTIKIAIAVPDGFDPSQPWPLYVVSSTVNASSIGSMKAVYKAVVDSRWVALAADGAEKPKVDSTAWRWALVASALEQLHEAWPASKQWPVACGGFSGGAKRSGYLAAIMMRSEYKVIGLWMGGCNADMASSGLDLYKPAASKFKSTPIFLSSGTSDKTATPEQVHEVMQSLRSSGFRKVRFESYSGEHHVSQEHVRQGLKWFAEQAQK